jgi:tRNA(fMet)-specific endonuclease VapC
MAVLIDTSVLVDRERGAGTAAFERRLGDEERAISVITVSELLHGVHRARGATLVKRRAFVEHVLGAFDALPITEQVARVHAEVWARLAAGGAVVGAHDLWIAATALAHGFGVVTCDAQDFARVPGLRVLDLGGAS